MKKVEIIRLEAHLEMLLENDESEEAFKKYTEGKLKEAGFDFTKPIAFHDQIHTITYTQEEDDDNATK